jgi:glycosyltransferase involved in cell wall biosynthesis
VIGRVDQLLAGFADGDAISHEALALRALLRARGVASELFADMRHVSPSMRGECRDIAAYRHEGIALHHYSIGSPVLDRFEALPGRKVLVYHNITPPSFFRAFDAEVTRSLEDALERLPRVAQGCDAVWAVSAFNAGELTAMGIPRVAVFPLLFDPAAHDAPDDPEVMARLSAPLTTWLTVGRIAPNKRLEDLIRAFHWYHRKINRFSRLVMIGSARSCPRYYDMLQMLVSDLDAANVCFEGFAAPGSLPTYYRRADVFVTTSAHEGFCLPLIEAMHHGALVVASACGGMPEALAGAGVLVEGADPAEWAVVIDRVLTDPGLRDRVHTAQAARLATLRRRRADEELDLLLTPLLTGT